MNQNNLTSDISRYVICYPGGSGGTFVASVLSKLLNNTEFLVDEKLGHCHKIVGSMPNFLHGASVESFNKEIDNIQTFNFGMNNVVYGHYRNIVAIKEVLTSQLGYHELEKTKFIKIIVDCQNSNEILFVASMLRNKSKCFLDMSFDEYLKQTTNYIRSWYWIENYYTVSNTINLKLSDIFLDRISEKINLPDPWRTIMNQCQLQYQTVQQHHYQNLLDLINGYHDHTSY